VIRELTEIEIFKPTIFRGYWDVLWDSI
jgi:hypothetical protein